MRKQVKKLSLSKETLRIIDRNGLQDAAGGATTTVANTDCGSACLCSATHVCSDCKPCA